ncbi:MAG: hypothetical protein IJU72_04755 [Bacteroidales bacterium]|nr:hypothetical protein [Bacteroidales bacterium]
MPSPHHIITAAMLAALLLANSQLSGQQQPLGQRCSKHMGSEFVTDGQEHIAPLGDGQRAEFRTTFFGHSTYRLAICSNSPQGHLVMTVYDTDKNLLFCNRDYGYSPYWDFSFTSTVTCIVQLELDGPTPPPSGTMAMLAIGFKH